MHIVTASGTATQNIVTAVNRAGVRVDPKALAMMANIPILSVARPNAPQPPPEAPKVLEAPASGAPPVRRRRRKKTRANAPVGAQLAPHPAPPAVAAGN